MKKLTVSKHHRGEYYSDVQFALMDGGHAETRNINKTTSPTSYTYTVADLLADGGVLIREMSLKEYDAYKLTT